LNWKKLKRKKRGCGTPEKKDRREAVWREKKSFWGGGAKKKADSGEGGVGTIGELE